MMTNRTVLMLVVALAVSLGFCGCGGGSSAETPVQPPATITISTNSLADAIVGASYSATLTSTCTGTCNWSISSGSLPDGLTITSVVNSASAIISGTPTKAGPFSFTAKVTNGTLTATKDLSITAKNITISTQAVPNGVLGFTYSATVSSDCPGSCLWTLLKGSLPDGLSLYTRSANATILGKPTRTGTFAFTLQVSLENAVTQKDFTIRTDAPTSVQGRNDSIATATPLTNGMYLASISPFADANGQANPDTDYYVLTAKSGATVQIDVDAMNVSTTSVPVELMDPVIEILDANGQRLRTCRDPGDDNAPAPIIADKTADAFDDECLNDDRTPGDTNSTLLFQPAGAAGTNQTFYVHVIEWRGDARPDILYIITVAGAN